MEKDDSTIIIKIDKQVKKKLRSYCVNNDTNMTQLLTELIKKAIEK